VRAKGDSIRNSWILREEFSDAPPLRRVEVRKEPRGRAGKVTDLVGPQEEF